MTDRPTTGLPDLDDAELGQLRDAISGRRDNLIALLNQSEHPAVRSYLDAQLAVLYRLSAVVSLAQARLDGEL